MSEYREEQVGEGSFTVRRYNLSLSICIPNMKFLHGLRDIFDEKLQY